MSIVTTLVNLYKKAGLHPVTGYNSHHFFNWRDAPFTVFLDGSGFVGCPGLALQEVMFLEHLGTYLTPANCLVIGNAMGWSTLATALTFPKAKTVGVDNAAKTGIDFTNAAFKSLGLNGGAVLGESPKDIGRIVGAEFDGKVDFVLIDALHENDAIQADFHAIREHATEDCVYLFHDVINWNMLSGFKALLTDSGLEGCVLTRTPSGMAMAYSPDLPADCRDYLSVFSDDANFFKRYRHTVRQNMDTLALFDQELP